MTSTTDIFPRGAASAAIFRGAKVLIAERGHGPSKGIWSLPGGKIEPGERAADAAIREISEETGLTFQLHGLLDVLDVIIKDPSGTLSAHYLLAVYYGTSESGDPIAATDISDARFVTREEAAAYPLTPGVLRLIDLASKRLNLD